MCWGEGLPMHMLVADGAAIVVELKSPQLFQNSQF